MQTTARSEYAHGGTNLQSAVISSFPHDRSAAAVSFHPSWREVHGDEVVVLPSQPQYDLTQFHSLNHDKLIRAKNEKNIEQLHASGSERVDTGVTSGEIEERRQVGLLLLSLAQGRNEDVHSSSIGLDLLRGEPKQAPAWEGNLVGAAHRKRALPTANDCRSVISSGTCDERREDNDDKYCRRRRLTESTEITTTAGDDHGGASPCSQKSDEVPDSTESAGRLTPNVQPRIFVGARDFVAILEGMQRADADVESIPDGAPNM